MEEQRALEVQSMPRGDVPAIADNSIIEIARQAEERMAAIVKIKSVALKVTNKYDWTNQGGKPYIQVSGSEKVARLFGISWRINEPQRETLEGGHFMFTYTGEFTLGGATIEAIGVRSSSDPFFSQKTNWKEGPDGKKVPEKIKIPPSEIDLGAVKKAALTNLLGNGITRILGIRNLTWEEVELYSGVKRDQVAGVEYNKGGKGKGGGQRQKQEPEGNFMSDDDLQELFTYCQQIKIPKTEIIKHFGFEGFGRIPKERQAEVVAWLDSKAAANEAAA